ncbi:MAG: hypothetical protein LBE76_04455 [Nitrososphaerota archaeon]|nr:hypothetical protein [Nitrososphaerota archaeon]
MKRVFVCCFVCGCVVVFVGVSGFDGGGGLVYGGWGDGCGYVNWQV